MDTAPVRGVEAAWAAAVSTVPQEQVAEHREIVAAVKTLNQAELLGENELMFQLDRETRQPIIQIVDRKTREVVLQIPPEYVLRVAEQLRNSG